MVALSNEGDKDILIEQGAAFCQGKFIEAFVAEGSEFIETKRDGGFGSTSKNK